MKIAGIDPSFSRTGIAVIDTDEKKVVLYRRGEKAGKRWSEVVRSAEKLASEIGRVLDTENVEHVRIEEPIPRCMVSGALWSLATAIYLALKKDREILYHHPSSLLKFHGKKGDKHESVRAAESIIGVFRSFGYSVDQEQERKMCHDEAEALIYSVVGLVSKLEDELTTEMKKLPYDFELVPNRILISSEKENDGTKEQECPEDTPKKPKKKRKEQKK